MIDPNKNNLYGGRPYLKKGCDSVIPDLEGILTDIRSQAAPNKPESSSVAATGLLSRYRQTFISQSGKLSGYTLREGSSSFPFGFKTMKECSIIGHPGDGRLPPSLVIASPEVMLIAQHSAPDDELKAVLHGLALTTVYGHDLKTVFQPLVKKFGSHIIPRRLYDTIAAAEILHFSQISDKSLPDLKSLLQAHIKPCHIPSELRETFQKPEDISLQQALLLPYLHKELMVEARKRFGSTQPVEIENAFIPELIRIEAAGIPVDAASLIPHLAPLEKRMAELNKAMEESVGKNIDVRDRIRAEMQPVQAEISFIKKFTQTDNGRVFATFNSYSCASGRISTCNPNVQGIRRDYKDVLYLALPGKAIISVDLPASQLRIASIIAQDKHLIEAIRADKDLHRETASRLFKKSPEEISEVERQIGKTANFQLLFGTGAESFKEKLEQQVGKKFNLRDVKGFMKAFREGYPGIAAWQDQIEADTKKTGKKGIQVTTLSGKKIHTCDYNKALNYAVAGSEAEIIKSAATYFATECRERGIDGRIINMIHDCVVVETAIDDKETAAGLLKEAVEYSMNKTLQTFLTPATIDTMAESPLVQAASATVQSEPVDAQQSIIIQENKNENIGNNAK